MQSTTIAVDLAKNVFEIAVSQHPGKVAERHRITRARLLPFFAERQPAVVLLEAIGSAHFWGRRLHELGHRPVLLPPRAVQRYRDGNKTDRTDAKAMLEASRNEAIRPVPIKTIAQQAMTSLHRLRSSWMAARTARINTLLGLLRELGVAIPVGSRKVVPILLALLAEADSVVPIALHPALKEACDEILQLEARIKITEPQLEALGQEIPAVVHLRTIPGVGLLSATALVAFVGDVQRFLTARHFASFLGLTPRNTPAAISDASATSRSAVIPICGASSPMAPAPCCASLISQPPSRLHTWARTNVPSPALTERLTDGCRSTRWANRSDRRGDNPTTTPALQSRW